MLLLFWGERDGRRSRAWSLTCGSQQGCAPEADVGPRRPQRRRQDVEQGEADVQGITPHADAHARTHTYSRTHMRAHTHKRARAVIQRPFGHRDHSTPHNCTGRAAGIHMYPPCADREKEEAATRLSLALGRFAPEGDAHGLRCRAAPFAPLFPT